MSNKLFLDIPDDEHRPHSLSAEAKFPYLVAMLETAETDPIRMKALLDDLVRYAKSIGLTPVAGFAMPGPPPEPPSTPAEADSGWLVDA
ncbi:MAG: hypothetical protein JWL76_1970 [Thermoleophilia bacterium]|nr:hypothetical protein [Thermoleophilia bacterium]